ncbi:hypothetical protein AURDEDRAFT_55684 [Auricularia subglabra TFB-10046 SS5]|nr:hypothetical protein AURDEDRAFT_55684 [Auricularia subglabra TFB-10046 SS5]
MAADDVKHKKRKHEAGDDTKERSSKKPKKDKEHKKGKRADAAPSEFRTVEGSSVISIPPAWAANPEGCAKEMLDSMLMRYIPALQGVLLSHSNLRFQQDKAAIIGACPFAVCTIAFRALVWGPTIGMKLKGRVNLCSPDHISLLVHRTFNVSIPRHHIPQDEYDYEWGSAENDPEQGAGRNEDEIAQAAAAEAAAESGEPRKLSDTDPRWVRKHSRTIVGDEDGYLEFTVVGLKLANQMLSLVGSIQPDPFSPAHIPAAAVQEHVVDVDPPPPAPAPAEKSKKKDKKKARDADDSEQPKKKRKKKAKEDE